MLPDLKNSRHGSGEEKTVIEICVNFENSYHQRKAEVTTQAMGEVNEGHMKGKYKLCML